MGKYDDLLKRLEDNEIYSAGLVASLAKKIGYASADQALLRIRISLNSRARGNGFPRLGDGWVRLPGQGYTPGWCGWRWKTLIAKADQDHDR